MSVWQDTVNITLSKQSALNCDYKYFKNLSIVAGTYTSKPETLSRLKDLKKMKTFSKELLRTAKQKQEDALRLISDILVIGQKKEEGFDVLVEVSCDPELETTNPLLQKDVTSKTSMETNNLQVIRRRRNAICEEIEKRSVTNTEGHTLREERFNMLQVIALKTIGFM